VGSKTLLSATELGLFHILARGPLDGEAFGWNWPSFHSAGDFLILCRFELLDRRDGKYSILRRISTWIAMSQPTRAEFSKCSVRLYSFWGSCQALLD
jgi:hypothetical protein